MARRLVKATNTSEMFKWLGDILGDSARYDDAMESYEVALSKQPHYPDAFYSLSLAQP